MGIMRDVGIIQSALAVEVDRLLSWGERDTAERLDEAWKRIRKIALESENRPSDEGKTTAWMNMPEAEEPSVKDLFRDMEKLKDDFFEQITRLQGNLCQVERRVDKIENGRV